MENTSRIFSGYLDAIIVGLTEHNAYVGIMAGRSQCGGSELAASFMGASLSAYDCPCCGEMVESHTAAELAGCKESV